MKNIKKNSLVQVIRFLQHGCKELQVSISEASMTLRSLKNSVKIRHLWSRSLIQFHDHWGIIASLNCYLQQIITEKVTDFRNCNFTGHFQEKVLYFFLKFYFACFTQSNNFFSTKCLGYNVYSLKSSKHLSYINITN